MKTLLLLLSWAIACTTCHCHGSQDRVMFDPLRQISNSLVNLKPLYDWEQLRHELGPKHRQLPPRPMTAWKEISFTVFQNDAAGMLCTMHLTNKTREFILIRNLPPFPMNPYDDERDRPKWVKGTGHTLYAIRAGFAAVKFNNLTVPVYDYGKVVKR